MNTIKFICTIVVVFVSMSFAQVLTFDKDDLGKSPKNFSTALTGNGKTGVWIIVKDETAPSQPNVLAQTDMDNTGYRFPICIYDNFTGKDVDLSVKFKPMKGDEDRAAGLVWRYKDKNNYYIVRANALEDNVVLYKVENGKRSDLPLIGKGKTYGMKTKVAPGEWGMLRIIAKGNHFEAILNGSKLFDVEDNTFNEAGKVGVWTKADSYTLFDDLTISPIK